MVLQKKKYEKQQYGLKLLYKVSGGGKITLVFLFRYCFTFCIYSAYIHLHKLYRIYISITLIYLRGANKIFGEMFNVSLYPEKLPGMEDPFFPIIIYSIGYTL